MAIPPRDQDPSSSELNAPAGPSTDAVALEQAGARDDGMWGADKSTHSGDAGGYAPEHGGLSTSAAAQEKQTPTRVYRNIREILEMLDNERR